MLARSGSTPWWLRGILATHGSPSGRAEVVGGARGARCRRQVLTVCSPLFDAFDETRLFQHTSAEQRSSLKRQFKSVFTNITSLVDRLSLSPAAL